MISFLPKAIFTKSVSYGSLEDYLRKNSYSKHEIDNILDYLINHKIIVSELTLPGDSDNMLKDLINYLELNYVERYDRIISDLKIIDSMIFDYQKIKLGEGLLNLELLLKKMETVAKSRKYLDCYFLSHKDELKYINGSEEREVLAYLQKLSEIIGFSNNLDNYKNKFVERFGYNQRIPLIVMFDPNVGIGIPEEYKTKNYILDSIFNPIFIKNLIFGKHDLNGIVHIDDDTIELLNKNISNRSSKMTKSKYSSLGLYISDKNKMINPSTTYSGCNRLDYYGIQNSLEGDVSILEQLPQSVGNSIDNKKQSDRLILNNRAVSNSKEKINLSDIEIYVDFSDQQFKIYSQKDGKNITIVKDTIITNDCYSIPTRFLYDISMNFDLEKLFLLLYYPDREYQPRLVYNDIILSPCRWNYFLGENSFNFDDFILWAKKVKLPVETILVTDIDKRMKINLYDRKLCASVLNKLSKNKTSICFEENIFNVNKDSNLKELVMIFDNGISYDKKETVSHLYETKNYSTFTDKWFKLTVFGDYKRIVKNSTQIYNRVMKLYKLGGLKSFYITKYYTSEFELRISFEVDSVENIALSVSSLEEILQSMRERGDIKDWSLGNHCEEISRFNQSIYNVNFDELFFIDSMIVCMVNNFSYEDKHYICSLLNVGFIYLENAMDIFDKKRIQKTSNVDFLRQIFRFHLEKNIYQEKYNEILFLISKRFKILQKLCFEKKIDIKFVEDIIHMTTNKFFGDAENEEISINILRKLYEYFYHTGKIIYEF